MHKFFRFLLTIILVFLSLGLISIAIYFSTTSYSEFIINISRIINKNDWSKFLKRSFPQINFLILRILLWVFLFCWFTFIYYVNRRKRYFTSLLVQYYKTLGDFFFWQVRVFLSQTLHEKIFISILIGIVFIRALILSHTTPMQYDELWTYNYFISGPFWKSFLLPGNNHILFTIVGSIFNSLPLDDSIAVRLPSNIAGVLTILTFWMFVRKRFNLFSSMLGTTFLATSVMVSMYMVFARSYMFVLYFFLIMFFAAINLGEKRNNKIYEIIFLLSTILGYLSNPVFMYGHVSLMSAILIQRYFFNNENGFNRLLKLSLISAFTLSLLYLPVLLTSHAENLIMYGWKTETNSPLYFVGRSFYSFTRSQLGVDYAYLLFPVIYIYAFIISVKKNQHNILAFNALTGVFITLIFSLLQKKTLSDHLTIFLTIHTVNCLMICTEIHKNNKLTFRYWYIFPLAMVIYINGLITYNSSFFFWSRDKDASSQYFSQLLLQKDISECFLQQYYFKPGLEYYFREKDRKLKIFMYDKKSQDYTPFDTGYLYKSIITDRTNESFYPGPKYKLIYEDKFAGLWIPASDPILPANKQD